MVQWKGVRRIPRYSNSHEFFLSLSLCVRVCVWPPSHIIKHKTLFEPTNSDYIHSTREVPLILMYKSCSGCPLFIFIVIVIAVTVVYAVVVVGVALI